MATDRIFIRDLLVRGIVGVNEWERRERQDILVNLELACDLREAARTDSLDRSVNYRTVSKEVIAHLESAQRMTVEALAEDVARIALGHEGVSSVRVRIEKPGALRFSESVGVEVERERGELG
jgi:FolB domain-containing protein